MCALNKAEDVNLQVFNMISGINESETLTKHVTVIKHETRNSNKT